MLNIKNLFVNFAARPVLKNINLEVEKGEKALFAGSE